MYFVNMREFCKIFCLLLTALEMASIKGVRFISTLYSSWIQSNNVKNGTIQCVQHIRPLGQLDNIQLKFFLLLIYRIIHFIINLTYAIILWQSQNITHTLIYKNIRQKSISDENIKKARKSLSSLMGTGLHGKIGIYPET